MFCFVLFCSVLLCFALFLFYLWSVMIHTSRGAEANQSSLLVSFLVRFSTLASEDTAPSGAPRPHHVNPTHVLTISKSFKSIAKPPLSFMLFLPCLSSLGAVPSTPGTELGPCRTERMIIARHCTCSIHLILQYPTHTHVVHSQMIHLVYVKGPLLPSPNTPSPP